MENKPKRDVAAEREKRAARKAKEGAQAQGKRAEKFKDIAPNPYLAVAKDLRLKRRFAQHFLIRESVLDRIVACLHLQPEETVLEIGPGAGFLTEKLLEQAQQVISVEVENRMASYLGVRLGRRESFVLHHQDILKFDFETVEVPRFKVVGNLPYQISSKILFCLVGELDQPDYALRKRVDQITIMVQKEVGERITARPGQKAYNPLSIATQFWYEPRYEFTVPASDFYPPPQVESAVVTLLPREKPLVDVHDMALFARLIRTAFHQKRKTLRNTLRGFQVSGQVLDDGVQASLFEATGIDSGLRAEALSIEQFGALSNAFGAHPGQS